MDLLQTPQKSSSSTVPIGPDTATRSRNTSGALYGSGDLTFGRTVVLQDLQRVPIVTLQYFKDAILPELLPTIDIASIKSSLVTSSTLGLTKAGWKSFPTEPSNDRRREEEVFEGLSGVFKAIIHEAKKVTQISTTLDLIAKPSGAPISARRNSSRPDAYLLLKEKKSVCETKASWADIAVSFEFKKGSSEKERTDNDQKLIWSLHNIMREDPCRRATFGVTIENTRVRLWFTCRSLTVVSESFNFITEVDELIYLFCSLAFASDEQLGWDPTIERVLIDGKVQYDITIGLTVYRTVNIISDFGAQAMRGRGTRVFEAHEKKMPQSVDDHLVVIKDAWRDINREREDLILKRIFEDIKRTQGLAEAKTAQQYFLTVLQAEDVMIKNKKDDTRHLLRGQDIPDGSLLYEVTPNLEPSRRSHASSAGNAPFWPLRRNISALKSAGIHHKQHFRIVFAEKGEPIFKLKTLGDVLEALQYALKGLEYMHLAGWVHRDLSPANVLRYKCRGLIMDLEYAKSLNSPASGDSHDVRTGTADYMACEVEGHKYLFFKFPPPQEDDEPPPTTPPFRFNPLHDLESWWWILTWVLHYYVDSDVPAPLPGHDAAYEYLFPGPRPYQAQTQTDHPVLTTQTRYEALTTQWQLKIFPSSFESTATRANNMRRKLEDAYEKAELASGVVYETPRRDSTMYFQTALRAARSTIEGKTIVLVPSPDIRKRKTAGEDASGKKEQKASKRSRQ